MPDAARGVFGLFLLLLGLAAALYPYKLARFEEMIDAIGSKRRLGEVEPADWKVALTRISGIAVGLVGAGLFGLGLLAWLSTPG